LAGNESAETAPSATEIEISIFGPGLGEALAVHLGHGDWMLVDSCLDGDLEPASLAYLESIGVSVEEQVKLVVASHWHDDHVGGLGKVVETCAAADFAFSGALHSEEFLTLVKALADRSLVRRSGVSEFAEVVRVIDERRRPGKVALESRRLWSRGRTAPKAFVEALSPCDGAVRQSQRALAELLPKANTNKRAVVAPRPNHASVVLWVAVGEIRMLLGADLEEAGDAQRGWTAILDRCDLDGAPASVFKIPHHGSANGDQPRVWEETLVDDPWAVMTPFIRGRHRLPTEEDKQRVRDRTGNAYLTADSCRPRRKRGAMVEDGLGLFDAQPVLVDPPMGHVRLRREIDAPTWSRELFGSALHLAP